MFDKPYRLVLLLLAAACSRPSSPDVSGESHWLMACRDDGQCGEGSLSCVCGTCTRACSTDDSCQGGACYDTDSPLLLQRCEARQLQGAGVCLATCEADRECGANRRCVEGACVLDELAGVDAAVSWSEPVREPVSTSTIQGDAGDRLGTWRDRDCDPLQPAYVAGCLSIVLERESGGNVRGYLQYDRPNPAVGPFAPAVDRNRGYPVEAQVIEYGAIAMSHPTGFPFSLLNGRISGGELSFEWNQYEVWRDWCELQEPYPWRVGERTFYFCVPQDQAQWSSLDPGKVVLCRSSDMMEQCQDLSERTLPCVCLDDRDPMCAYSFCSCSAQGCGMLAKTRRAVLRFSSDARTAVLLVNESPWLIELQTHLVKVEP